MSSRFKKGANHRIVAGSKAGRSLSGAKGGILLTPEVIESRKPGAIYNPFLKQITGIKGNALKNEIAAHNAKIEEKRQAKLKAKQLRKNTSITPT